MPKPRSGKQVRLTTNQREEIRDLYRQGVPYEDIVERYRCSLSNFWLIVRGLRHEVLRSRFNTDAARLTSLDPAKLGWVAGILDGEGYIGLVASKNRSGSMSVIARVEVASVTRVMQDTLKSILGFGLVYERTRRRANERIQFSWAIWSASAVGPLLSAVLPYLVVKREVAAVVHTFCESRVGNDLGAYTEAELRCVARVKKLNARGFISTKAPT